MDQPAPVTPTAPVSRFDFGKPVSAPPIRQEPLSTLAERIAAQNPVPPPGPAPRVEPVMAPPTVRVPGPAPVAEPVVARPAPAPVAPPIPRQQATSVPVEPEPGDFDFDFGFDKPAPAPAAEPVAEIETGDPIADLIAAELDAPEPPPAPAPVAPPVARVEAPRPPPAPVAPPSAPASLRPSFAARPAESDRFGVSPDTGLNMRAAPQPTPPPVREPAPVRPPEPVRATEPVYAPEPAPRDPSDPMSEIESLIGEAVRVQLAPSPGPVRVQAPQTVTPSVEFEPEEALEEEIESHLPQQPPVVPPLATPFAPRRANLKEERRSSATSAEDAILAAVADSGIGAPERLEPSVSDEGPYRRLKVKPQGGSFLRGGMRQLAGIGVAALLLLAAGVGLYWVLNMGRAANVGAAPELTADATPAKVKPVATEKPETDASKSPVLAKMDGSSTAGSEQLVSTDQTGGATVPRDVTTSAAGDNGLANRKVRTVTVRPDGTIVSGDDALAGGEALPIDRPNVPVVPSAGTTALLGGDTGPAGAATPAATGPVAGNSVIEATDTKAVVNSSLVAPTPMTLPVRSLQTSSLTTPTNTKVNAVAPGPQTLDGQVDLLNGGTRAPQQVATTQPAPASASNAAAYVQLSSMPSEADANAQVRTATARYGSLFGGNKLVVQQVDLGQKGVRYRVRLPAASLSDARDICAQIKAQGGDCLATNG